MEGYILQWMDNSGGIDGGLHPAVDGQWRVFTEGYILQWMDSGECSQRATSCSGWTAIEGVDRGLHPAVDRQRTIDPILLRCQISIS